MLEHFAHLPQRRKLRPAQLQMLHQPELPAPRPCPESDVDFAVYLIEPERSRRIALAQDLRERGFVVRPFLMLDDFAAASMEIEPGVVVLDVAMMRGPHAPDAGWLASGYPTILLFDRLETEHAIGAVRLGAIDLIRRPAPLHELVDSVCRAAVRVEDYRTHLEEVRARDALDHLSPREREVMRFVVGGLSTKQMARELDLSPRTVEMHRRNLYRKLGVSSVAALVVIAMRGGHRDWI